VALKALKNRQPSPLKLVVPASTSNVGPGFDALGIALNLVLEVAWKPGPRNRLERKGALAESVLSFGQDPVRRGMRRAAMLAGRELPTGELEVRASFPPARGLGASGAGLTAGLLLGNRLTGNRVSKEDLLQEAIQLEGHPENAAASFLGGGHWSLPGPKGGWIHLPVALHRDLRFLLVLPPYPLSTGRAREVLPVSVPFGKAVAQSRRIPALLEGLRRLDPELLRAGIEDDLHVQPRLKQLAGQKGMLAFARESGALGATLSGAGSALLVLTRSQGIAGLEKRLAGKAARLWGESGGVLRARPAARGAFFR